MNPNDLLITTETREVEGQIVIVKQYGCPELKNPDGIFIPYKRGSKGGYTRAIHWKIRNRR